MKGTHQKRSQYLQEKAASIVNAAAESGLTVRLLGGLGIYEKCASQRHELDARRKPFSDVDLLTSADDLQAMLPLMADAGFEEDVEWRLMVGHERRLFFSQENLSVDLFIDPLRFCQTLHLGARLRLDCPTLQVTDLFLSRIQRVGLTATDLLDLGALLSHSCHSPAEIDRIEVSRVASLAARSWGWWKTLSVNLVELEASLPEPFGDDAALRGLLTTLREAVDGVPKSLRWRLRSLLGTMIPWYREVE